MAGAKSWFRPVAANPDVRHLQVQSLIKDRHQSEARKDGNTPVSA